MVVEIEVFGIPVFVEPLSLLIGLLIWYSAIKYIKKQMPSVSKGRLLIPGFAAAAAALISIVLHEFAHAIVARWAGIKIVEAGFYGLFAYVMPETPLTEIAPWKEIVISFAGPAMNLLIGGCAAILVILWDESIIENTVQYIAYINIALGRLNLIPLFVLDGGKVLHGFLRLFVDSDSAWWLVFVVFIIYALHHLFVRDKNKKSIEDKLEGL